MKIAFCGHSYHLKTGSSSFLLDALRRRGAVQELWDDSWITGSVVDLGPIVEGGFDAVVVWQVEELARRLAEARVPNVSFFPMYDACHAMPDDWWRALGDTKVVCFCRALHERLQRLGLRSRTARYYPDPSRFDPVAPSAKLTGFFWQRQQDVTWTTVQALLGDTRFDAITLHRAVDPSIGTFVAPSGEDVSRHGIRITDWFPSREEALREVSRHGVYFSPRLREGIGMSFLEAMAMGMLVVAPDQPTMNEYLVSGVNGLLYDPREPRPLDFSRRAELGAAARRAVETGWRKWRRSEGAVLDFVLDRDGDLRRRAPFDALDPLSLELRRAPGRGGANGVAAPARAPTRREGGRRLREGVVARSPRVTVAVVTRNAEATLAGTLESALAQDLPDLEVIVVDGASTDGTLEIVARFEDRLDYWRSGRDGGPYDGMNAAAALASGRYIVFMNAGDWFQTADALSMALADAPADADVVFGHHVYRDLAGFDELHPAADFAETWEKLREGRVGWRWLSRVPGHQATLTRAALLRENPYRSDLRIAADHELLYRLAKKGARFHHSGAVVATYVSGGFSWRNQARCLDEWRRIALEYTERPDPVARAFREMTMDLQRSELPVIPWPRLLLRLGRVPGATRELKRRVRTRLARAEGAAR